MVEDLEKFLIEKSGTGETFDSWEFAENNGLDHDKVVGALKSLSGAEFVVSTQLETRFYTLTDEAKSYVDNGSPEFQFLKLVSEMGKISAAEAKKHPIGFGKSMRNKWLSKEGEEFTLKVNLSEMNDDLQENLKTLVAKNGAEDALEKNVLKELNKRKLLKLVSRKHYSVEKGPMWAPERKKVATTITKEMIDTGSWKDEQFKATNWHSTGLREQGGYLHPLLLVRMEYRKILIGMGFEEMPTNKWVESSFWNFDALFQPQQHPARDAHDTFFIKQPAECSLESIPKDYVDVVRKTHEVGGFGSIGYRYDWSLQESKKNLLRTHTTAGM
uniref:Phenylalanine--tRNA ligase n=1 Tax=Aplanochytrium stocchinoi TaxID=215587 RepID=A0A7S3PH06_9STRA